MIQSICWSLFVLQHLLLGVWVLEGSEGPFWGWRKKIRGKIKSQKTNVFQGGWPFSTAMFLRDDIFLPGKGDLRGELEKHAKMGIDAGLDF